MAAGPWDGELLEACASGDPAAQAALYRACSARVYSIALNYFGGDPQAASDVTQDVFLKLFRTLPQFRGQARLTTWLHRLVVNECLDARRALRRWVGLEAAGDPPSPGRQDELLERQDVERRVRAEVSKLPPKLRIAVLLKHFEDLSYEEMAEALGCSTGTVASRLHRGHARPAERLAFLGQKEART